MMIRRGGGGGSNAMTNIGVTRECFLVRGMECLVMNDNVAARQPASPPHGHVLKVLCSTTRRHTQTLERVRQMRQSHAAAMEFGTGWCV